jgi:acetyl esterase/lipase
VSGPLPSCFIMAAGDDSWCLADSLALAQSLSAAANPYELHVMEGMPHGFMQMSELDGCRAAMRLMWEFLARNDPALFLRVAVRRAARGQGRWGQTCRTEEAVDV